MLNLNAQLLFFNAIAKILQTSVLRTPVRNGLKPFPTCRRLFFIFWIVLLLGCGYQIAGKETHVPPGLNSVAIPTFINHTYEPGIEIPFTQAFLREFIQDRRVKVSDRAEADSILEGVIKSFNIYSVSYDQSGLVLEYQTTVVIDLTLKKRDGGILWKENNLSETRWYRASSGVLINESNKAAAIQQIGRFIAERVRNRFFYNF
jgi:outer membrane lipopolysaccharide assembly protein LptE/RlpB